MATIPLSNLEYYPALTVAGLRHVFVGRAPGIDVAVDRAEALARLDAVHAQARRDIGLGDRPMLRAEQVHGNGVFILEPGAPLPSGPVSGVDALATDRADVALGIYVADCCAVYIVAPQHRAVGLAHSGKKGTELGIAAELIAAMGRRYGSVPAELIVQLSPCIRPPFYEVDFAAQIASQCRAAGVLNVHDCGANTAADLERYYSYRMEKGRTGRMLAMLGA